MCATVHRHPDKWNCCAICFVILNRKFSVASRSICMEIAFYKWHNALCQQIYLTHHNKSIRVRLTRLIISICCISHTKLSSSCTSVRVLMCVWSLLSHSCTSSIFIEHWELSTMHKEQVQKYFILFHFNSNWKEIKRRKRKNVLSCARQLQ